MLMREIILFGYCSVIIFIRNCLLLIREKFSFVLVCLLGVIAKSPAQ